MVTAVLSRLAVAAGVLNLLTRTALLTPNTAAAESLETFSIVLDASRAVLTTSSLLACDGQDVYGLVDALKVRFSLLCSTAITYVCGQVRGHTLHCDANVCMLLVEALNTHNATVFHCDST